MAGFGNEVLNLIGDKDPRLALLAAVQGRSPAAPGATPSGGAGDPATAGAPAPAQPAAYTSPPQLMDLYMKLQERQNRAETFDAGLGLLASSFAQPHNRNNVMAAVTGGRIGGRGGSGGGRDEAGDLINNVFKMQATQAALEKQAANRAALPSIASKYGLDLQTAQYLFDSGKLDDLLSTLSQPDAEIKQLPNGQYVTINKRTAQQIGNVFGPEKADEFEVNKGDDGTLRIFNKTKGTWGDSIVNTADASTTDTKNWKAANADRVARGLTEIPLSEFLITQKRAGAGAANVGPNNVDYGTPPKDFMWDRNADGSMVLEDGKPKAIVIPGSATALKNEKTANSEDRKEGQKVLTSGLVSRSIDDIFKKFDDSKGSWTTPIAGFTGSIAKLMPGTTAKDTEGLINTVSANIGFEKLQQMRENSPTGGALGQVSDFENKLLQSTFGTISQDQSPEQLIKNLSRVKALANAIVHNSIKDQAEADAILDKADAEAAAFIGHLAGAKPKEAPKVDAPGQADIKDIMNKYLKAE